MPNTIDATGLTLKTREEIIDEILNGGEGFAGLYSIYGPDINVESNSPDGNLVNLIAQIAVDYEELLQAVYDSFDPDQATGINLDLRCAINGVVRQAGTYSEQEVLVTVTQALTLDGLDTEPNNPFTISDASGNQFFLAEEYVFGGAGSATLTFRSAQLGAVVVAPNTLTTIVTVTLGVASVSNGSLSGTTGTNEETDYALRIRRAASTAIGSKGYLASLYSALGNVAGVTSVSIQENIGAHTIWCVVAGGDDDDVAEAIYIKRSAGVGMIGDEIVLITQVDGTDFNVQFDRPTAQDLWIEFDVAAITGTVDPVYIRAQLLAALSYEIGASADASAIVSIVKGIAPNASVSACQVSDDNATYVDLLAPTGFNYQFEAASARIVINGVPGS